MGLERGLAQLVSVCRRAGLDVSPAQAIDAQRAAMLVGVERREDLCVALRSVLVTRSDEQAVFDRIFDDFFRARGALQQDILQRLRAGGFSSGEVADLRALLEAMIGAAGGETLGAMAGPPGALEDLLAMALRQVAPAGLETPGQLGFQAARVLDVLRVDEARRGLSRLRTRLRQDHGDRGDAMADALSRELDALRPRVREDLAHRLSASQLAQSSLERRPFAKLEAHERRAVEREVRRLAERWLGRAHVRRKRARAGHLDVRATMRASLRTGGVPFHLRHRIRRPLRTRLVVLCDVSDSMRDTVRPMLVLLHSLQRLFEQTRSFVFVSDVGEITGLFARHAPARAIALAQGGSGVELAANSHYARVFQRFADRHGELLGERVTLVVIGDGRSNHLDPGAHHLASIARRVERLIWLHPQPEWRWGAADSDMDRYAPHCDLQLAVPDLQALRLAVDRLLHRIW